MSSGKLYQSLREQAMSKQENSSEVKDSLGATCAVYQCIRKAIGASVRRGDVAEGKQGRSVGSSISAIVEGLRDGGLRLQSLRRFRCEHDK